MRASFHIRQVPASQDGIALVLVLAFIVLLTILIVSFISFSSLNRMSTVSYSKEIMAQEIAEGGLEDVLTDLHQEILAGSTLQNGGSSSYAPIYVPTANWTAQPARLGYNPAYFGSDVTSVNLPPSLVRVSRASQDGNPTHFYPALNTVYYTGTLPQNRASPANSSASSVNGRYISAERWNKIALLSTNTVIAPAFSTNTPDWVYVTRTGSRVCATSDLTSPTSIIKPSGSLTTTTDVVGRYAYVIYDEGALLDVNAAGYVSSATNSFAVSPPTTMYTDPVTGVSQVITGKTYTSYADFTQLPGFTSSGAQNAVDNLISWRNASVTLTGANGGVNFYQAAFNNAKTGFKIFSNGDSPLLSRQDLINYFAQIDPSDNSYSAALPFLGTFTRAANAPSWAPPADSASLPGYVGGSYNGIASVNYKSNAESPTTTLFAETSGTSPPTANSSFPNPNRDIPNVRYAVAATITHYADDGTTSTYTVKAGDPLVQHRFSLAKLAWLTYSGPNSAIPKATAQAIQDCFGLQWTTNPEGYACWKYAAGHQEGTPAQLSIETLDEVAAEGREPNFFEMLKAGILAGSIGQMPGPLINGEAGGGVWSSSGPVEGVIGSGFITYSGIRDRHILQIGANLIDQSDTDSYPTDIYMTLITGVSQELDLSVNNVYGDENLPLISRINPMVVAVPSKSYKLWFQPEIWNPHQAMGIGTTAPATVPTNFRAHAYGTVQFTVKDSYFADSVTDSPLYYDSSAGASFSYTNMNGSLVSAAGSDLAVANFTDPHTGTLASPFYSNPIRLDQNSAINGVLVSNTLTFPTSTATVNYWGQMGYVTKLPADYTGDDGVSATASGTPQVDSSEGFVAIFGGECDGIDLTNPTYWSTRNTLYCQIAPSPSITFSLDYADSKGVWHPYSFMTNIKDQSAQLNVFERSNTDGTHSNYNTSSNTPTEGSTIYSTSPTFTLVDPRTDRLSCEETTSGGNGRWNMDCSVDPGPDSEGWPNNSMGSQNRLQGTQQTFPYRTYGFVFYPTPPASFTWESNNLWLGFWTVNQPGSTASNAYCIDPDGVVRPADAYRRDPATMNLSNPNSPSYSGTTTGNGSLSWNAAWAKTSPAAPTSLATATTATNLGSAQARRPVVLNRPFRSVGEMGYAYRDVPFKTLDFFSKESGDAALLDLFCVSDEPSVSAGQVNISNAPASVIKALLKGASKMDINNPVSDATGFPNFVTSADATAVSTAISTYINANGPLGNRADMVTKLSDPIFTALYSTSVGSGSAAGCANYANKAYAEAPMRAMSAVGSTRTWNLLIDVIAQTGFFPASASSLDNFAVEGERRYWLHVSIDRYTGKIIDQQLEPVYE